jgi:hypothetical protein
VDEGDGWDYSSEGDLDPDLAEEAGYAGWDPPGRAGWPLLYKATMAALLVALLFPIIWLLLR